MFRLILSAVTLSAFLIAAGCSTPGTRIGRAAPRVAEKKTVYAYRLANGFTVLVRSGETTGPSAVQVWTFDGSAHEPPDKPGLAHFVEHMLFEGPAGGPDSPEYVIEGMGGSITGNTGKDYSYVGVTLPGPGWERAVELLYGMTVSPSFTPERAKDQQEVVALEIEYRSSDPERVVMDNLMEEAYITHPYKAPITGMPESVRGLTSEDALKYHRFAYLPSGMTLAVSGNMDPAAVRAVAERTFGTMPPGEPKKMRPAEEPVQITSRERYAAMPVSLSYLAMGWHICPTSDRNIFPLEVLCAVLGQGAGSRLSMELAERRALVLEAGAELFAYRDRGLFVVTATLADKDDVWRVKEELLRQALKLKTELVSQEELERAVMWIDRRQMEASDTAEGQAYALGYWATVYGGESPGEYMDAIRAVTPEDVRRAAQTYLGEGNYTLSAVVPEK